MDAKNLQVLLLCVFAVAMFFVSMVMWRFDGGVAAFFLGLGWLSVWGAYSTWKRPLRRGWRR